VVASLLDGGLVKPTGALKTDSAAGYVLVQAAQTGLGRDLW